MKKTRKIIMIILIALISTIMAIFILDEIKVEEWRISNPQTQMDNEVLERFQSRPNEYWVNDPIDIVNELDVQRRSTDYPRGRYYPKEPRFKKTNITHEYLYYDSLIMLSKITMKRKMYSHFERYYDYEKSIDFYYFIKENDKWRFICIDSMKYYLKQKGAKVRDL